MIAPVRPTDQSRDPLQDTRRARIALYSHDTMGLGHMRRNLILAQTLCASSLNAVVLMVAGAREAAAFPMPPGVDCLTLPSLSKNGDGHYGCRHMAIHIEELIALRSGAIQASLDAFDPDIVIVDNVPRGAVRELDSALMSLRSAGRTRVVLGLRDVLDDAVVVRAEWSRAANEQALRDYYDLICVYGDRRVCDPAAEYGFSPDVASLVRFAGYLDQRKRLRVADDTSADVLADLALPPGRLVLGFVGGGQDGTRLAEAFSRMELPPETNAVLVTGPFMPKAVQRSIFRRLKDAPRFRVLEFLQEPTILLSRADRIVAMGGYGTTSEILSFEKHALIVPRVKPRQEQLIRAERLAALGLVHMLHPNDVTAAALAAWIASDLGPPPSARSLLDFGGLDRMPALLEELLERQSCLAGASHRRTYRAAV
jgi:predicted glycosyltransferase